jgi:Zn-dependent protease
MVKCDKCGVETYMPFRCNYCGGYFCEQHRLPEFHDCKGKYDQTKPSTVQVGEYSTSGGFYGNYSTSRVIRPFWFSRRELRDLAIGLLIIMTLPFIKVWSYFFIEPLFVVGIVAILALAFILHELAHKFSAQRLGMWAEFQLSTTGLILTFLSFILMQGGLPLMIVAPGAVMIKGLLNWNDYGKISIAGPATNIAQALIYLFIFFISPNDLAFYGIEINAFLALFNLIPFGVFDGMKIYKWDKRVWAAATLIAGLLVLLTITGLLIYWL